MHIVITFCPTPNPILSACARVPAREEFEVSRPQGMDAWSFIFTAGGGGYFEAEGIEHAATRGHFYAIEPGTSQHYGTHAAVDPLEEDFVTWWVHVHPRASWSPWMGWPEIAQGLRRIEVPASFIEPLLQLLANGSYVLNSRHRMRKEIAMCLFEQVLLTCDDFNPLSNRESHHDPRILPALNRMGTHYTEPLSVAELATRCHLSPSVFAKAFRRATGTTPIRYLENQRIERAIQLLQDPNRSVTSVAEGVGFANVYYFSLRFKKATGLSPSAYRKRNPDLTFADFFA